LVEAPSSNGVEELGWLVWATLSELLINAVNMTVPKLLTGTNQKVCGRIFRWKLGIRRHQTTGGEAGPNPVL